MKVYIFTVTRRVIREKLIALGVLRDAGSEAPGWWILELPESIMVQPVPDMNDAFTFVLGEETYYYRGGTPGSLQDYGRSVLTRSLDFMPE